MDYISSHFKIDSFLDHITLHPDHYDMLTIATSSENPQAATQYMNRFNLVKTFNNDFLIKAKNLIDQAEHHSLILPEPVNNHLLLDHAARTTYKIKIKNHLNTDETINLTRSEYKCATHLANGYTAKKLAKMLSVSPRTIEFHTNKLKMKFNVNSKYELIKTLNTYL